MRPLLPRPLHLLVLLFAALSAACGVRFSSSFEGTEFFKSISLEGERIVGSELLLAVTVNQAYPVPVRVACFYENGEELTKDQLKLAFEERAATIGEVLLPAATGHRPDDDVEPQDLTFRFKVDEPGDYFVACLTPAAPDNGIGLSFKIRAEPAAGR